MVRGSLTTDEETGCRTLCVTLPMPPSKGNMRGHTRQMNRVKLRYWAQLEERRKLLKQLPDPPDPPLTRVIGEAVYYVHNRLDYTNAATNMKWPEDYLVEKKYLAGDSPDHLQWAAYPTQIVDRQGEARMTLILREVPDGDYRFQ